MKRFAFLLICLACAAGGFALKAVLENDAIAAFFRDYGLWIAVTGFAVLITLGLILVFGYLYLRRRLRRLLKAEGPMTEAEIAEGLVDMLTTPEGVTNPTPKDRQRTALVNAGTWLMRRQATQFYFNATVTVVGGLVGAATIFLLYEQNQKITLQSDAAIVQSVLLEGTRRANLAGDMTALFSDIRLSAENSKRAQKICPIDGPLIDCWLQEDQTGFTNYYMSSSLLSRVAAFATRNTPYRIADALFDELNFENPLREQYKLQNSSPERGQLFQTLALNDVSVRWLDFTSAQLTGVNLSGRDLSGAKLHGAQAFGADFSDSWLNSANLDGADLRFANLFGTRLRNAALHQADLRGAEMATADLTMADLRNADLRGTYLGSAILTGVNLSGAKFEVSSMEESFLVETEFEGAWAWNDESPTGLPDEVIEIIQLCKFLPEQHTQIRKVNLKPKSCEGEGGREP